MSVRNFVALAALLLAGLLTPAHAGDTPHWVHYRLLNGQAHLPKKVVIMPVSVRMYEVTAGGVQEEVREWSTQAETNVHKAISALLAKKGGIQEVALPRLSASERAAIDEHMALYKLVANTVPNSGLHHKLRRFDYGIGPGLNALLARTGADAVLMVYGNDYASTAGRKTKAVLGKIPIVNIFTGGEVELGHSFVHLGFIELKSGDLLWMNSEYRQGSSNLRDYDDAEDLIEAIFDWYPGIERYREQYASED